MLSDLTIQKLENKEYQKYANSSYEVAKRIEIFSEIAEF